MPTAREGICDVCGRRGFKGRRGVAIHKGMTECGNPRNQSEVEHGVPSRRLPAVVKHLEAVDVLRPRDVETESGYEEPVMKHEVLSPSLPAVEGRVPAPAFPKYYYQTRSRRDESTGTRTAIPVEKNESGDQVVTTEGFREHICDVCGRRFEGRRGVATHKAMTECGYPRNQSEVEHGVHSRRWPAVIKHLEAATVLPRHDDQIRLKRFGTMGNGVVARDEVNESEKEEPVMKHEVLSPSLPAVEGRVPAPALPKYYYQTRSRRDESTGTRTAIPIEKNESGDQDLKTCEFEHESIRNHLVQFYKKIKSPTRGDLRNAQRCFARRFELALIWDTLVCGTRETKFFEVDDVHHSNMKKYEVSWDEKGALSIGSIANIAKREEMEPITVQVEYFNPIFGKRTYICNFGDTLSHLRTMLSDGEDDFNHNMNKLTFYEPNQGTKQSFRNPKVSCGRRIKHILDGKLVKTIVPKFQLKKMNESFDLTEKVKGNEAKVMTKIRLEMRSVGMTYFEGCIKEIMYKMQDSIANEENEDSKLMNAFKSCASVHYIYCDQVDKEEYQNLANIWEHFLNMACLLYDHLLMWRAKYARPVRNDNSVCFKPHRWCTTCTYKDYEFVDKRNAETRYGVNVLKKHKDLWFCEITNVIYLITCTSEQCDVRYVGKTKKSIAGRYPSGSKAKEKDHFEKEGHSEHFYILQIVNEESLFRKDYFKKYVRDNPVDLKGVEKLWIDQLIDKEKGDLNDKIEFTYGENHRRHMSELLRYYICKHKVIYVVDA